MSEMQERVVEQSEKEITKQRKRERDKESHKRRCLDEAYLAEYRTKARAYMKVYRVTKLDKQKNRLYNREWARKQRLSSDFRNREKSALRKYKKKIRMNVLAAYGGPICKCCKEKNAQFLTLDHINNDGSEQRRRLFGTKTPGSLRFYQWLRTNNYPPGIQILCYNCNQAKGLYGSCPHQRNRT